MLVATRDPFHPGSKETPIPNDRAPRHVDALHVGTPRLGRFMFAMQLIGSLVALPVGIGSAYSIYRANFSVETTCQSLRANIVGMLDKSVDAATRHMLVRRDVEAFEQSCGSVDPDATAAFKNLLAADQATKTVAKPPAPVVAAKPIEKPVEKSVEAQPTLHRIDKAEVHAEPKEALTEPAHASAQQRPSDAEWLGAVRAALVNETTEPKPALNGLPAINPALAERPLNAQVAVPASVAPQMAPLASVPAAAPPLPAAVAVAPPPQSSQVQNQDGHPVPPAAIPQGAPLDIANAAGPTPKNRSRLGEFITHIPLLGRAVDAVAPN